MLTTETDRLLSLVRQALDDIDERPVSVTARRTARIASMLGETEFAVRLEFELKPSGGHALTNAEDTRRLMADPSLWSKKTGAAEVALHAYMENRTIPEGHKNAGSIYSHGLSELEALVARGPGLHLEVSMTVLLERVRHSCFVALCGWERQLTYSNTNERIFERFRGRVDVVLATVAPEVLDQFSTVHRRLRDVSGIASASVSEELAQAVTTCRRILKAVVDHLLPGTPGARSNDGHSLDDSTYKNRLFEYLKANAVSDTSQAAIRAAVGGVYERFGATDRLASKGVHAEVGLAEAELCAINTYIVAGELLTLGACVAAALSSLVDTVDPGEAAKPNGSD